MKIELPKLETFLEKLQRSWKAVETSIKKAKKVMNKWFDKERWNLQGLKQEDNICLKAKNIQLKQPSKKLDQEKYRLCEITKNISQGAF